MSPVQKPWTGPPRTTNHYPPSATRGKPDTMVAALVFFSATLVTDEVPQHLAVARKLVDDLRGSSLNAYGGGKRNIEWGPSTYTARTVCSSFATLLLQHTYGWTNDYVKEWIGL